MKYVLALLFLLTPCTYACELSDEYKKARSEARKWQRYEHEECFHSVSSYLYWQRVAKCKEEERGKNIGGGCQHVAGYEMAGPSLKTLSKHCESLKISNEEREKALSEHIKQMKIQKCSSKSDN